MTPLNKGRLRPWVSVLTLLLGAGFSAAIYADDLLDVYRLAQTNDPTFESARYALEAARQQVPQALSALLPSVAGSGTVGRTLGTTAYTDTPIVDRGFKSYTWKLQLTQPLIRAENLYAYDESHLLVEQAKAQFELARQDLILRVARAYFDTLLAQDSVAVAETQIKSAEEQQAVAERGYTDGTTSVTDVHEAKARADLARSDHVAALNDLNAKRAELEKIVGPLQAPLAPFQADIAFPRPDPDDEAAWKTRAQEDNPNVHAQKAALQLASADVGRQRSQRLPTVDVVASYGRNYSSGNIDNPIDYSTQAGVKQIGLQLSMPILDAGGIHATVMEAKAKENKARADLEVARRQAGADAREAFMAITSGLSQLEALKSAVESTTSSVQGNRAGYKAGLRINSDVLQAEQQLGSTQRDLAKARYDLLLQGFKLKAAAGALSDNDLLGINSLLTASTAQ
jgi:outer membrane protein